MSRPVRRLLLGLTALALMGLAVLGVAAVTAVQAAADVEQARVRLAPARLEGVSAVQRATAVDEAIGLLERAQRRLSAPQVDLAAALPVVGRSWVAERRVVDASRATLDALQLALQRAPDVRGRNGEFVLPALVDLSVQLTAAGSRASRALDELRGTPTELTPNKIRRAVSEANVALSPLVQGLSDAGRGAAVAGGLLGADGPRRLLVALENNAELRGTGGYVSTFATGVLRDGALELEPFRDVEEVSEPPSRARSVDAPVEFVEDYGPFLADTTLWRNWNMSPDVPASASVGARVAGELLGATPDVVLLLDVPALTAVVRLAGDEVVLGQDTVISPDELTEALLVDSYARAGTSTADQRARRAQLRSAATTAIRQLLADDLPPVDAARTLAELAAGRHLALWSAREEEQVALTSLGVSGAVDPAGDDLALVSLNNFGANKLDYYAERAVTVDVTLQRDAAQVVQTLRLSNQAPAGLVPYVAGLRKPGTLLERVELSVSAQAAVRALTVDGAPARRELRRGRERTRVATYVEVPRGEEVRVELRYDVPVVNGSYRLRLLPQPLVQDAQLVLRVRPGAGEQLGRVEGADHSGGVVDDVSAWSRDRLLQVELVARDGAEPRRWDRIRQQVKDFWNSPVRLPGAER